MENLKALIKKFLTKEVIFYTIFGVLTTIVNIATFYLLTLLKIEENIASNISIVLAVLFAYFTNRKWVFNSTASMPKEVFTEFYKFIGGRAFTMVVEAVGFYLLFSILGVQKLISKLLISVVVIILNFFISKFFAFKKSN